MALGWQGDPAAALWLRVNDQERQLISPLLEETPVAIGQIAAQLAIDVVSLTLAPNISGLIKKVAADRDLYEIHVNNTDAPVRQRFTVAHEIAHYLLHRDQIGTDGITDSILYRSKLSDRTEAEANKLAAALLLPWIPVNRWHQARYGAPPTSEHIDVIATHFKVSSLAVGFRFGF
jgi:Zn-dependent peptidase ImmA (M78 family)